MIDHSPASPSSSRSDRDLEIEIEIEVEIAGYSRAHAGEQNHTIRCVGAGIGRELFVTLLARNGDEVGQSGRSAVQSIDQNDWGQFTTD